MEFKHYFTIFARRKWIVIITTLVTALVAFIGTQLIPPTYTATSILRIATAAASSSSYSDYMFADRLINTYLTISTSRPLLEELKKELSLSDLPGIEVSQIPNSELIQVSVQSRDANLAKTVANTLGNILISQSSEFYTGSGKTPADVLKEQVDQAEADLNKMRADYYTRLAQHPEDEVGNQTASKAVDSQQQLYYTLLSQYQQMRIRQAIQSNIVSIVETAVLPTTPSSPNKPLNMALGVLVGAIGGLGLAFIFENLDTTLYNVEGVRAVTPLHPIGRIPLAKNGEHRKFPLDGNSFYGDAFFRLRTNLTTIIQERNYRILMLVSSLQGEGKTTIICSLAYALAQSGKKVILVDCDFRNPSTNKLFNLPNKIGLSNYLQGEATLDQIIQGTKFIGLHMISGGKASTKTVMLLDSPQMKELIPILLNNYDYVLLDTPAVLAVTDTSVIAPLADGILLVTKLGLIAKEKLASALEQISNVKANLIGLVINGDTSNNHYYYEHREARIKGG